MSFELPKLEAPKQKEVPLPRWEQELIDEYEKKAKKYFGERKNEDYEMYSQESQKCWYFSPHPKEEGDIILEEGLKINQLQDEAVNAFYGDSVFKKDMEQGEGAKFMEEHFDKICREYKIHLQPTREEYDPKQKESRPFCVNRLIRALAVNPEFRESIDRFKVSYGKEIKRGGGGELIPEIIIYPRYGRENFGKALAGVYQHFKDYEKYGNGMRPRYNATINGLVFIAQSGGDLKDSLKRFGVLDDYFDKANNYAFRKGEKLPLTVEGAASFMELFVALEISFPQGLRGTQRAYEVSELKKLINRVRAGGLEIDAVTRAGGLRSKVKELLEKEKTGK